MLSRGAAGEDANRGSAARFSVASEDFENDPGTQYFVGTLAIDRFLRPICYQSFPDNLVPAPLKHGAQANIPYRLDGKTIA